MIERKDNSTGSAFGPIIVMIDASRLGHSLATALKDRPHGIPIQPNRSLPLRPPPPIPKKNSPISQALSTQKSPRNRGANGAENNTKDCDLRNDEASSLGAVDINFYDSKDEADNSNDKYVDEFSRKIPKYLVKNRHTKSLDNKRSDETSRGTKRRKSCEYETISRNGDSCKKRNISNIECDKSGTKVVQKERKKRGSYKKRRKVSSAEENSNVFRKEKLPAGNNINAVHTAAKLKAVSLQSEAKELVSNSQNFERVHSSGVVLPTIFKSRYLESTSPQFSDINTNSNSTDYIFEKSSWKQTSSNTYKLILPKPPIIPKCPMAIPIDIAHAMNQGDSRNTNIIDLRINEAEILRSQTGNVAAHTINQNNSMKPKINNIHTSKNHISQTIEEIENTLPSMPSLEDLMQSDGRQDKLTLHRNQVDCEKFGTNLDSEVMPIAEARILQSPNDLTSKINNLNAKDLIQVNTTPINDQNLNQPHESILNLTTVLEIKIPGRSPELIILKAPQIMPNGKGDSTANNSPVEPTTPVSLFSGIQPAHEEPKKIAEPTKIDMLSSLREYRKKNRFEYQTSMDEKFQEDTTEINHPKEFSPLPDHQQQCEDLSGKDQSQYMLQHKSPVEFEVRIRDASGSPNTQEPVQSCEKDKSMSEKSPEMTKDSQARPKIEEIVRCRRNRHNLKLRKLYEEERHLRCKMSQTSDPSRRTRLQQRINCTEKKIENTQKYLNKLLSIENPESYTNPAPSRIQVRQDLVEKIPSEESVEYNLQSPLKLTEQVDRALSGRSSPLLSPIVITISESDSASSGEETDTTDGKSPDNIESNPQSDAEVKSNDEYMPENDAQVASTTEHPLPDDKAEMAPLDVNPEITNNNVEYLNKNLSPVSESVSPSVNTASMSIPPLIRDPINYSLSDLNAVPSQKSPSVPYSAPRVNLPADKNDAERSEANCTCSPCLWSNKAAGIEKTAKFEANNSICSAVSDLRTPNTIRRTAIQENTNAHSVPNYPIQGNTSAHPVPNYPIQENTNAHSVPNYPVHRADYRTTGNVPSMFSRNNGGANINLSSPLQGHSALPLPPPYYRNLTAQGFSMPAELSPNHQTMQFHNQHPPTKPSMQFTPDQDSSLRPSLLAAHLLNSSAQEAANFASSIKLSSLAQSKDAARTNPATHVSKQLMTAQFPTFGNWAARMTRESTVRKSAVYSSADRTGYKTTGSDMYKMTATAIDPTNSSNPGNIMHSAPQRPCPEQPRPIPGFPPHRSISRPYPRDYPPNSQFPQNSHNGLAKYPGPRVFMPYPINRYHQIPSGPQNTRSTEYSNSQSSHGQQNARQYQHPTLQTRPLVPGTHQNQANSSHLVNAAGMMPQQYPQQPPPYSQAVLSQWYSVNNYPKNYVNSQFNGFNGQIKPMDNNSPVYRPTNKNIPPMQPYHDPVTRHLMQQNVPNVKLASPVYNMTGNLNSVIQDGRNAEPMDLGRSYMTLQSDKVHKSLDRSSNLKCSRCGLPDPKFHCFGCETAFYCNEQCQIQHWDTHFIECPKKMPKLKKVS